VCLQVDDDVDLMLKQCLVTSDITWMKATLATKGLVSLEFFRFISQLEFAELFPNFQERTAIAAYVGMPGECFSTMLSTLNIFNIQNEQ